MAEFYVIPPQCGQWRGGALGPVQLCSLNSPMGTTPPRPCSPNPLCRVPLLPLLRHLKRFWLEPDSVTCRLQAVTSGMSLPLGASVASPVKWAIPNYTREGRRKCLNTQVDLLSGETGRPWTAAFHFTRFINTNSPQGSSVPQGTHQNKQLLHPVFCVTRAAQSAGTATPLPRHSACSPNHVSHEK